MDGDPHFSYILELEFSVQVEKLDEKKTFLQLQVDEARRNLQVIDPDVLEWLERVEKIKQDSDNLVGAVPEDQNGTCLNGKCPKPKLRYFQSRQATKLTADVVELLEKPDKFQTISYPPPPMGIEAIPPPSGTHEFQSRKEKEEEIMACLKNDTIFMIGVCGMGGVGKTTMAKKIWRRASEEKIFDEIVMTEGLSEDADQPKIQQQIAECLGLELTKEMVPNRARLLHNRLMGKKVLLVLDDVWKKLDLEELGIPSQRMNKGCKIMLTTRNDRVCIESTDDATKIIELEVLREEEAWSLFRDKTGSVVDQDDLRELAIDVAKECKGLPLAIATVGSALKHRTNIAFWKDALLQLGHSAPTNIPEFLKDVYQPLQLSYNALESNVEARYLFLICCLFPEDDRIDLEDLVQYGIGLGIFSNIRNIGEARDRVCVLVGNLKSRFLVMDATYNDVPMVKMHDVVRDMAIWISSKGTEHVLFKVSHDIGLSEWPIKDSCENYTSISLTFGKSIVIPKECMNCPRLEALRVVCNYLDEAPKLPDTFFNRMSGLRLLIIYNCIVPSSSLSLLTQLRVLRLYHCGLKMISFIGELVNLEILCLWDSDIVELPDQMGALTKLKVLDLNHCENLKKIAPGVISRLVQLEELRLVFCPIEWEGEEKGNERSNASVVEVFPLRNLRALEIWIKDPQVIPHDIGGQLQELTSCYVRIGQSLLGPYTNQKCMSINVDEIRKSYVNSMCVLFMAAEHLYLDGKGLKDIIEVLERQGFQNVKRLLLSGIDDLEEICDGPPTLGSFFKLEQIRLYRLPGLMYLWKCSNEKICLPNLKKIMISECEELKWVFPLSMSESLCQIETIEIENCPNMEEVLFKDEIRGSSEEKGGDSDMNIFTRIKFPKLKHMRLRRLPKLSALCKAVDVFDFPSITTLEISKVSRWNHKMLGSRRPNLFNKEVTCPNLCELVLNGIKTASVIFSQEFHISGLKELEVKDCHDFKSVVGKENDDLIPRCFISKEVTFHNLCKLVLHGITTASVIFSHEIPISELQILEVRHCHFKSLVGKEDDDSISRCFITKEVTCSKLKNLVLDGLKFASLIFSHEIPIESLSALEKLEVQSCHNLKSLISLHLFGEMTNLEQLVVRDCSMLEVVLAEEEVDGGSRDKKITNHSKFKKIELSELPKLRSFYSSLESFPLPKWLQIHGIKDPEFASRVFFNKEHCQDEDNLSKGCFTLFASDLSFTCVEESPLVKGLSDVFFHDGWWKVCGRFGIEKLSPNITYEIIFVIMLRENLNDGHKFKTVVAGNKRKEDMSDKPMEEWIEIVAGEFSASSTQSREIAFSIANKPYPKEGIILKCVHIRPKEPIE